MAREVLELLTATWSMLEALWGLILTSVGAFVVVRWMWRRAFRQPAEKASGGDGL